VVPEGADGLGLGLGDHDALAGGETVGLDHVRGLEPLELAECGTHLRDRSRTTRGDLVPLAELLRPRLRALDARPGSRRTEDAAATGE
jgi:hypothetical protein